MFFYDPEFYDFLGLVRSHSDQEVLPITPINFPGISPPLGIRFEMAEDGLAAFYPSSEVFQDPEAGMDERNQIRQKRDRAFAKLRELGIDPEPL
jgi:hypothetical protein